MKATIKHEASRISTWGLGAIAALGTMYDYLPEIKAIVPPAALGVIGGLALVGKVLQKALGRKNGR